MRQCCCFFRLKNLRLWKQMSIYNFMDQIAVQHLTCCAVNDGTCGYILETMNLKCRWNTALAVKVSYNVLICSDIQTDYLEESRGVLFSLWGMGIQRFLGPPYFGDCFAQCLCSL